MLQRTLIISKNALNKSCVELNFLQKTYWTYISFSLRSRGRAQIFGVVNLSEVLFENELILHQFIVSFLFIFQLLIQLIFTGSIKYNIIWFLSGPTFSDHIYFTELLEEVCGLVRTIFSYFSALEYFKNSKSLEPFNFIPAVDRDIYSLSFFCFFFL